MKDEDKKTILVVDDSVTIRNIIQNELTSAGYQVVTAVNGVEALSILSWMKEKPDLIVLDIEMPKMGGFETCAKIREDYHRHRNTKESYDPIPVIFVSATDSLEYRRTGFQLEVTDFITKPFSQGEMAKIVDAIFCPTEKFLGQLALVVDDSLSARTIISKLLQRLGVEVIEVENGVEALTVVESGRYDFDLIVTDYLMPEMRGDEFCRLLRQKRPMQRVPVIIVSGSEDQDLILAFFKAGATDYLAKPFAEEELQARLQSHLQARQYSQQLEKFNQKLKHLSERDGLTDVYNRRFFEDSLQNHFENAKQSKRELSCILLDLDFFKKVNDEFGHGFGDLVLIEFADLLRKNAGRNDIVARYGGEEFILILPGKNLEQAQKVAEAIREATEKYCYSDGKLERQVTASCGVSSLLVHVPENPDRLVSMADEALYAAKENGRNSVGLYEGKQKV